MTLIRCALAILPFTFAVQAQWAVEDDGCRTPDLGVGTCTNIYKCKPIIDLITKAEKPLSTEVRNLLTSYQCGLDFDTVKVCCPGGPINYNAGGNPGTSDADLPDVTNHKNLNLLPRDGCGFYENDDRVINGNVTGLFEFPWMALISYWIGPTLDFRCGATLINDRYILTAAHCITHLGRLRLAGVRLGEHNVTSARDCEVTGNRTSCRNPVQDITIEEVIPHPEYNKTSFSNDIGLLRLSKKADISTDSVTPICLPVAPSIKNQELDKVTITGWGRTENDTKSNILLKVDIEVVPNNECQKKYQGSTVITNKQICAGGKNMKDSCAGDSGGPLQVVAGLGSELSYFQHGIVSFGPVPCGIQGKPGVYTKVAAYMDFILDNMRP